MKTMLQKIQTLGHKAAMLQEAVNSAPAKFQQVRDSIQLTAGHLQQARAELQEVATGLHVENDEDFTAALNEIATHSHVFHEAGYDLTGIDLEMSQWQRVIVHFERKASVPEPSLRYLLTQHTANVTVASIISSIIKAEALSEKFSAPNTEYAELAIHMGAAPAVRLRWREIESASSQQVRVAQPVVATPHESAATGSQFSTQPALPPTSTFAQSTYFEKPSHPQHELHEAHAAGQSAPMRVTLPTHAHRSTPTSIKSLGPDWKKEALERLKSSPGVSKYSR